MRHKKKVVAILILAAFSLLILASARPPVLLDQGGQGEDSGLLELESLFSGDAGEAGISQIILGRPAMKEIYAPPYAGFFRNSTFGSFLNTAIGHSAPHMNYSSLDQSIIEASMPARKSHLQPILLDGPDF